MKYKPSAGEFHILVTASFTFWAHGLDVWAVGTEGRSRVKLTRLCNLFKSRPPPSMSRRPVSKAVRCVSPLSDVISGWRDTVSIWHAIEIKGRRCLPCRAVVPSAGPRDAGHRRLRAADWLLEKGLT